MPSSDPSTPDAAGTDPSDERLDFADAADTLVRLQEQLQRFQDMADTLDRVADTGSDLADASQQLADAQRDLADAQAAAAQGDADPVSASVSQSVAALHESVRSLKADVQDVADRLDAPTLGGPRRPSSSVWNAATGSIVGLLVVLLGLVGAQWFTGGPGESGGAVNVDAPDPVVQRTLYPHQEAVASIVDARVQVLNGVGESGLASRFKDSIESAGAQVPAIGNLPIGNAPETRIYLHRNAFDVANALADRLGLDRRQILPGPPATGANVDLTLVVGADYATLAPYQ